MIRVGLVVVIFSIFSSQIWQVGLAALVAMFFGWGWSIRLWRKLTPTLSISLKHFSRKALRALVSTGGWIAISLAGAILYLEIDLLVVNRMLGPEAGGRYAAVAQWSLLLRTLVGVIASLFGPTILYIYARRNMDTLGRYGRQSVKMIGLFMALPIGLICGLSTPLLQTWLGPEFTDLSWLMSLMTIHLSVNLAVIPLCYIQTAANRVRMPAIVTIVMGVGNVGLAVFFTGPMGWGLFGPVAAGAVALTAKNLIFTTLHAAHILNRRLDTFLWDILPITIATVGLAALGKLLVAEWDVSGWFHLAMAAAGLSIIYSGVGYWILLSSEERALVWSLLAKTGLIRKAN